MRRIITASLAAMAIAIALPGAAQAAVTLQPGAYMETDVGSCTLNFAYAGSGKTYLGTAAHCVESIGQPVRDIEGTAFGRVAFIANADVTEQDFAFIEVDAEDLGRVSPAVKGHPQYPKGSTVPTDTLSGDTIQLSGYGLGYDTTPATQERRQAVMGFDDAELYTVTGPIHWGDSGGPLVHIGTGKALGIVSRLCAGTCSEEGPTVQGILAKAASRGFPVTLRTV
jgi:Trypsin-like peptidase domain